MPDERAGEVPRAYVVRADPALTEEHVKVTGHLTQLDNKKLFGFSSFPVAGNKTSPDLFT